MKQSALAAAAAIAALVGLAGTASAQAFSLGEVYVKGFGGATWPSSLDATLKEDGERIARPSFDYDTGYVLGAAVGAAFTPNVSMELEYAYRSADVTFTDRDDDDESGRANGDTSADAFMVNALYVFDGMGATGAVQPYLGGGIGGANVEVSAGGQDFDADTLLAYQVIGGVGYELNPNVSLYAEGRWFQTESGKFDGPGGDSFDGEFETFDLLVGLRYVFGPAR
jgi:opacity protein-like surface antigen